jgi:hypothetical protein
MIFVNLLHLLSICPAWARDVQPRVYHDTLFTAVSEYPKSYQLLSIFIESEVSSKKFYKFISVVHRLLVSIGTMQFF